MRLCVSLRVGIDTERGENATARVSVSVSVSASVSVTRRNRDRLRGGSRVHEKELNQRFWMRTIAEACAKDGTL